MQFIRSAVEATGVMRPWLLAPVVALLVAPAGAQAQAQAPDDDATTVPPAATTTPTFETPSPAGAGGTEYGAAIKRVRPLHVSAFSVSPGKLTPGTALTVTVRVDGSASKARMRVVLVPSGAKRAAATLNLGWRRVGRTITRKWTPRNALAAGSYVARVHAVDGTGRTLKRTATASGKQPVTVEVAAPAPVATPVGHGVFPVRGPYSFGGPGARFGAKRDGHTHQGQDVVAAEGTPLVSPVAGTVYWRAVQASGAGHYLVIRGTDGVDYVFMHLVAGSELVDKGDPVTAGQQIGQVGNTGDSEGPHLHFEIWPGGWYAKGSQPIDPLPTLQAWAAGR
jgi:murein DD-endopeptidase MepM/ murein hydrolase activator NlpD